MSADVSQEVDQLLKEREKYRQFLQRLEERRGETSEAAYERVRSDYAEKLQGVIDRLQSHGDSIRSRLREVEGRVSDLQGEKAARSEELEEARLRHSVGEYSDPGEWEQLEEQLVGQLQQAEKGLQAARAEIERLQEIVSLVEGAGEAPPAPQPEPQPAGGGASGGGASSGGPSGASPPQESGQAPPQEPQPAASDTSAGGQGEEDFVDLGDLVMEDEEVGGDLEMEPAGGGGGEAQAPSEPEPPSGDAEVGDELAFLESLSLSGEEEEESGGDSFSFLEQHGQGTPQTIICPHCSAANDPAEWYCTECGEELPAE